VKYAGRKAFPFLTCGQLYIIHAAGIVKQDCSAGGQILLSAFFAKNGYINVAFALGNHVFAKNYKKQATQLLVNSP
jgi:hypothetical protein